MTYHFSKARNESDLIDYLDTYLPQSSTISLDTENLTSSSYVRADSTPYSFQISCNESTSLFVPYSKFPREIVTDIAASPAVHRVTMHYAFEDMRQMHWHGIPEIESKLFDTFHVASHLQSEPGGLKALSYRHFRQLMTNYSDLVWTHASVKALNYLTTLQENSPDLQRVPKLGKKGQQLKATEPNPMRTKVDRWVRLLRKDIDETAQGVDRDHYDVWERIVDAVTNDESLSSMRNLKWLLSKVPPSNLTVVPENDAINYGCMDAVMTFRLATVLEELSAKIEVDDYYLRMPKALEGHPYDD